MAQTREIKVRIKAVANIQRITKTMQMIATARFRGSLNRVTAARPYSRKIAELVTELSAATGNDGQTCHPLLCGPRPAVGRELLLVLTSNRGLCGGYNASLLRKAVAQLGGGGQTQVDLEVVGKKGHAYFKFTGTPIRAFHSHITDAPQYRDVEQLAERYIAEFTAGQYDAVKVLYMAFHSMGRQSPQILDLLPLAPVADKGGRAAAPQVDYDFSPPAAELLGELLPVTVKVRLFQCFTEAVLGEHIARMTAMKAATDAAGDMSKRLTRKYNRARQTAITTELSEIIGGSAALE